MGLKITKTDSTTNLTLENAYCRITRILGSQELGYRLTVGIYLSKAARDAGYSPAFQCTVLMPHEDKARGNVISIGYKYLKTRSDWQDAIDV